MKQILTLIFCISFFSISFAQKAEIKKLMDGNMSQETFVQNLTKQYTATYNLNAEQQEKIQDFFSRKAANYTVLAGMKSADSDIYNKKMESQAKHTAQSMRMILTREQYRKYLAEMQKAGYSKAELY